MAEGEGQRSSRRQPLVASEPPLPVRSQRRQRLQVAGRAVQALNNPDAARAEASCSLLVGTRRSASASWVKTGQAVARGSGQVPEANAPRNPAGFRRIFFFLWGFAMNRFTTDYGRRLVCMGIDEPVPIGPGSQHFGTNAEDANEAFPTGAFARGPAARSPCASVLHPARCARLWLG